MKMNRRNRMAFSLALNLFMCVLLKDFSDAFLRSNRIEPNLRRFGSTAAHLHHTHPHITHNIHTQTHSCTHSHHPPTEQSIHNKTISFVRFELFQQQIQPIIIIVYISTHTYTYSLTHIPLRPSSSSSYTHIASQYSVIVVVSPRPHFTHRGKLRRSHIIPCVYIILVTWRLRHQHVVLLHTTHTAPPRVYRIESNRASSRVESRASKNQVSKSPV